MSPFFKITEIKLPENNFITNSDIHKLMINSAPLNLGENIFILSKNRIKSELAAAFPAITDISIKKEPFHGLIVNFEKRIQIGIWCRPTGDQPLADNCYYFDKEGIIFKEAPITEGALILRIQDFGGESAILGGKAIKESTLNFIAGFNSKIIESDRFGIVEFKIKPASNLDLEAVTDRGFSVYLDETQDPAIVATNLFAVLDESVKNSAGNLAYIDLRIPNGRIFYCPIGQKCADR